METLSKQEIDSLLGGIALGEQSSLTPDSPELKSGSEFKAIDKALGNTAKFIKSLKTEKITDKVGDDLEIATKKPSPVEELPKITTEQTSAEPSFNQELLFSNTPEGNKSLDEWIDKYIIPKDKKYKNLTPEQRQQVNEKLFNQTRGLWEYFVQNGAWQIKGDKLELSSRKTFDIDAKISLLFLQIAGLEKDFVNYISNKPSLPSTIDGELNKKIPLGVKRSSASSLERVFERLGLGELRTANQAYDILGRLSVDYLYNDIVNSPKQLKSSPHTLRGLARFLDARQLLYYVYEKVGEITDFGRTEVPFNELYNQILDSDVFKFKQYDKTAGDFGKISKFKYLRAESQDPEWYGFVGHWKKEIKQIDISEVQQKIVNKAQELFGRKNLVEIGREFKSPEFGRVFINIEGLPHSLSSDEFGGTAATRAFGYDSFVNVNLKKGGFLFTTNKPTADLGERLGGTAVHWGMVIKPEQKQKFSPAEVIKILKSIDQSYEPQGELKNFLESDQNLGQAEVVAKTEPTQTSDTPTAEVVDEKSEKMRDLIEKYIKIEEQVVEDKLLAKYPNLSTAARKLMVEDIVSITREELYNKYTIT